MAVTPTTLYAAYAPQAQTAIYTVPASTQIADAILKVFNEHATAQTVLVYKSTDAGTTKAIVGRTVLATNESDTFAIGHCHAATVIYMATTTASALWADLNANVKT